MKTRSLRKFFCNSANMAKRVVKPLNEIRVMYITRPDTRLCTEVVCGWAGAVMKHANSSIWAGAVMQKTPKNAKNVKKANSDWPTKRLTDPHSRLKSRDHATKNFVTACSWRSTSQASNNGSEWAQCINPCLKTGSRIRFSSMCSALRSSISFIALYSMIHLVCNISWGHNCKSNRDNLNLKKVPER